MAAAREPWVSGADRALAHATARVRLLAAATPANLDDEIARLAASWPAGRGEPRFVYAPRPPLGELADAMDRLGDALAPEGPLAALYAERARELAVEARLLDAVGAPSFRADAARRFAGEPAYEVAADALAAEWLAAAPPHADPERLRTDDVADPRSLLCRLREEVGRARWPVRVVVRPGMSALAATGGDGTLFVAAGRWVTVEDVERTVLHEIEGHVRPWVNAGRETYGIFRFGTARGSDDQEGRALLHEARAGYLRGARARELALRHVAAVVTAAGASFIETAALLEGHGAALDDVLRIAARVQRGGGLARERVYLTALVRQREADDDRAGAFHARGRVSVASRAVLEQVA